MGSGRGRLHGVSVAVALLLLVNLWKVACFVTFSSHFRIGKCNRILWPMTMAMYIDERNL